MKLARSLGKRIHVLHVTTADEIEFLSHHKDVASVELTPQHLTLAAPEAYERLKGYAQMNPPIRDEHHRAALWRGLATGVADVLGSDHAPHTKEEKARPYPASPSGMPGVQTLLPIMLTHVAEGSLTLERLVDLTSHGPQRIFGLADKGRMAEGFDADLTIVDLAAIRTIRHADTASRAGWTPFDGFEAQGWPMATIIRGRVVMREGEVTSPAHRRAGAVPGNASGVLMRLRIASWNINSVRLRADQVRRFVAEHAPDVLCLQEIKCREGEFPTAAFVEAGLPHLRISGQKGWHGVAIASRLPIEDAPALDVCREKHARSRVGHRRRGGDPQLLHSGRRRHRPTGRSTPSSTTSSISTSG